jgi:capsular polysaccharide biosynthesis protein
LQDGQLARPALKLEELETESPIVPKRKLNIPLIVAICVGVGLCCACIILVLTTGLGLSLLDFSALSR